MTSNEAAALAQYEERMRSVRRELRGLYDLVDNLMRYRVKNKTMRAKLAKAIRDLETVAALRPFVGPESERKAAAAHHYGTVEGLQAAIRVLSGGEV